MTGAGMRALAIVVLAPGLMAPALAAAPTGVQKQEFYSVCVGISGDQELCTCKADAAMTLIDERFMGVVLTSMQGGSPAPDDYQRYNSYVARSNQLCKPNY